MKILVVDDETPIRDFLKDVLQEQGYDVLTAAHGHEALSLYQQHRPPFTLADIAMPGMTGLDLLNQIKSANPEAVVILMTGAGKESYAVQALRGGAVNYFNKPIDINELIITLNRYRSLAAGFDFEHFAAAFLARETLELELKNSMEQINHAVQMIVFHCRSIFPLSEIYTLRFGIYEMMVNAVEHGNLEISFEEKSQALEENRLTELIRTRSNHHELAKRRVSVLCHIWPEGLRCTIRDQGPGFNASAYTDQEDPADLFEEIGGSLHGRGIILTRLQFDDVRFNDKGNEVVIFKAPPGAGGTT